MSATDSRIKLLPDHLINQIAAGEVIERPASVVKELMENSLDAGATRLEIDIEQGGRRLIRIRDNGSGMSRQEIPLALCRHATSKIRTLDDLETVASLGFRGEALPSIASVSRFTICSRTAEDSTAWRMMNDSEQAEMTPEPAAHPVGTSIEVRDLFYNTPARRKFLRTEQTEYQHILELVKRLALSCYATAIQLRHNHRQVLNLNPVDDVSAYLTRVRKVLGSSFTERLIPVSAELEGLSLEGWIGHPDAARSQSDMQYFFLNGRMVRDRRINHAIRMAFDEAIYPGRYPCYLLYLHITPEQIDVNVHPAKSEVRFSDTRLVHDFIASTLRQCLGGRQIAAVEEQPVRHPVASRPGKAYRPAQSAQQQQRSGAFYASAAEQSRSETEADSSPVHPEEIQEQPQVFEQTLGRAISCIGEQFILSSVGTRYCLTNLTIASQHLAAGILQRSFEQDAVRSQPLLMPLSLQLVEGQSACLEKNEASLKSLGIEFDLLDTDSLILRSMPAVLRGADLQQACEGLIQALEQEESRERHIERLIETLSQHVVIPREEMATREAMNALLRRFEQAGLADRQTSPPCYRYFAAQELQDFIATP